jgi:glycosyltransferase involved in cell wall biosynthesis
MKIAMIGHKRIPSREGGIEIVVGELATRMVAKGNTVVAYNRKSEHIAGKDFDTNGTPKNYNGVKLVWVATPNSSKLNAIVYSAFATIRAIFSKYDVIHFHAEGPASMVWLAKLFGKRCVVTIHGLDWKRSKWGGFATKFLKFGEKTAVKYADEIIVLSNNVKQYFMDTYGRSTHYIPNAISKPEILEDDILKNKFGIEKDSYILYLGRLVPEKGVHYLIEAYKTLNTDKKLVIAGSASHSTDYANELKIMADGNNKIIFTDFVQGEVLAALYSNAYLYCLPSDVEGMPISLLEAMSYGKNCLVSNIDENTQITGKYATTFAKGDVCDLKNKLSSCLQGENRYSENEIATYVLDKYNWDNVVDQTLLLYKPNRKDSRV